MCYYLDFSKIIGMQMNGFHSPPYRPKHVPVVSSLLSTGDVTLLNHSDKAQPYISDLRKPTLDTLIISKVYCVRSRGSGVALAFHCTVHRRGLRLLGQLPVCPPRLKLPLRTKYIYILNSITAAELHVGLDKIIAE